MPIGWSRYIWFDHYCQHASTMHPEWVCPMNHTYASLAELVRTNQPGAVILGQDTKQTGGEGGFANYPLYYTCDTRTGAQISNCKDSQTGRSKAGQNIGASGSPSGAFWKSPESDCSIYSGCHPWFASDTATVQSVDAGIQHWELTVGRGAEYILNLPPSKAGVIGPREAHAAEALGAEVARRYGCGHARPCKPSAAGSAHLRPGESMVLKVNGAFNRVWLGEDAARDGQLVTSYKLEAARTGSDSYSLLSSQFNTIKSGYVAPAGVTGATIGLRHLDDASGGPDTDNVRLTVVNTTGGLPANVTMMVFSV